MFYGVKQCGSLACSEGRHGHLVLCRLLITFKLHFLLHFAHYADYSTRYTLYNIISRLLIIVFRCSSSWQTI